MKKRILNVACGNDTYGTDFIDLYPQRKEVKKCAIDFERLPYEDNTFNEIRSYSMFEHLKNHGHFLNECFRVLKKGGILDLKTDSASYWYYALDNKTHTERYEAVSEYGKKDRHFGLFTDHHLRNYFEDIGFRFIKTENSYDNAKPKGNSKLSVKGKIVLIINFIFTHIKPLKKIGCSQIQIRGTK
jgi:ubiquinone/menaquinone biosynthesis C-methylase UbiE